MSYLWKSKSVKRKVEVDLKTTSLCRVIDLFELNN